ncbi:hypothetical protein ACKWTF_016770 [Chironomus riparius]
MTKFSKKIIFSIILINFLQKTLACDFKCPSYLHPYPNPYFHKSANGCGTSELNFDAKFLPNPNLEYCCNEHDYCYETCGVTKQYCDINFRKCMMDICGSGFYVLKCQLKAKIFFETAKNLGCNSYLKSQQKACICH